MARIHTQEDVEYAAVDLQGDEKIFKSFDDAAAFAISTAGEKNVDLDILVRVVIRTKDKGPAH